MFATKALRQAAAHAERQPLIKFIGKRNIPASVDHTPQPHPAAPGNILPGSGATTFSKYREHAQQFGPLRKTIKSGDEGLVGGTSGHDLGPVQPSKSGVFFDRNELPSRFHRQPLSMAEIEAIETGGAALFA